MRLVLIAIFLLAVVLPVSAQRDECNPEKVIDVIETIDDNPIGYALDVFSETAPTTESLTEAYLLLMNFRRELEGEWDNIKSCNTGYVQLYNAELRIISALEDYMTLFLMLRAGISNHGMIVNDLKEMFGQTITDNMDLILEIIEIQD